MAQPDPVLSNCRRFARYPDVGRINSTSWYESATIKSVVAGFTLKPNARPPAQCAPAFHGVLGDRPIIRKQPMYPCEPARYTCYRANGPLSIDGKLDEPSWLAAPKSTAFVDIVTGQPAWFDTRVALLWDDENLYFGFWAEETDVWGTLTERDSKIYEDNDLELFIAGQDAYYEFEINALNTVYEVFWVWKDQFLPGAKYFGRPEFDPATRRTMVLDGVGGHVHERGERWGFLDWDYPGLRTAVHVDGVVNRRDKTDRGWTVELAFPWKGLEMLHDGRSLPPKDRDVWRIDCSRFEKIGKNGEALDPSVGWTWNRHGHYDSHIPEVFPYVTFSTQSVGERR